MSSKETVWLREMVTDPVDASSRAMVRMADWEPACPLRCAGKRRGGGESKRGRDEGEIERRHLGGVAEWKAGTT